MCTLYETLQDNTRSTSYKTNDDTKAAVSDSSIDDSKWFLLMDSRGKPQRVGSSGAITCRTASWLIKFCIVLYSAHHNDSHHISHHNDHIIHHILSFIIISYHIISHHIIPYIISYNIISYHISDHVMPCRIISYPIAHPIKSYIIYHIILRRAVEYRFPIVSHHIISDRMISHS